MGAIHREAGFRFVISLDDHEPTHVHAVGADEAGILIAADDDDRPHIVYASSMTAGDLRPISRIVETRRAIFPKEWAKRHG